MNASTMPQPTSIIMGGYGPPTTSFSRGLTFIGDRLKARFGNAVEINYVYDVYDVSDPGHNDAGDLDWLVENAAVSLAYRTMAEGIPEMELAALPFLFSDIDTARAAMDGALGQAAVKRIEGQTNYRILGFFENGFRHVSNNVRPLNSPADFKDLTIRMLGMQKPVFELLGAIPMTMGLPATAEALEAGILNGQENPFENTVSYNLYPFQRFHTATSHSYLSRPIFILRSTFDAWPDALQIDTRAAVKDAVTLQRQLHDKAEIEAAAIIQKAGGEIIDLTPDQRQMFIEAVEPLYEDAKNKYGSDILRLVNL